MPLLLRLLFFVVYAVAGVFLSYDPAYLRGLGFSGPFIGAVQMAGSALGIPAAIAWAKWADSSAHPKRVLLWCAGLSVVPFALLLVDQGPLSQTVGWVLYGATSAAMSTLVDGAVLRYIQQRPGQGYSAYRSMGSIGYAVGALGVGYVLSARGDRPADPVMLIGCGLLASALVLLCALLPNTMGVPSLDRVQRPRLGRMPSPAKVLRFLAALGLHGAAWVSFSRFFALYVTERHLPSRIAGVGLAVAVVAEVAVFFGYPRLERVASAGTLLPLGLGLSALRWLSLAFASRAPSIVGIQLLHGATVGLFLASSVELCTALYPEELRTSGQAWLKAATRSGETLGVVLMGWALDHLGGSSAIYLVAAGLDVLALGVAWSVRAQVRAPEVELPVVTPTV